MTKPLEDRVTQLEQQFLEHLAGSNQQMATLNRVVAQQHLDLRDIEKNLTILLGIASGQEHAIKTMQADMSTMQTDISTVQADVSTIQVDVNTIRKRLDTLSEHVETQFAAVHQRLTSIDQRLDTLVALLSGKPPTPPAQ